MPFLVIDGDPFEVTEASEGEPIRAGSIRRMYDNSARSTMKSEKRVWNFTFLEMTGAAYNALRLKFALGARVPIEGDALIGAATPVTCMGTLQEIPYLHDGAGFLVEPSIKLEQA